MKHTPVDQLIIDISRMIAGSADFFPGGDVSPHLLDKMEKAINGEAFCDNCRKYYPVSETVRSDDGYYNCQAHHAENERLKQELLNP